MFFAFIGNSKNVSNFATEDRPAEARSGLSGRVGRHIEKRLSALILDCWKFSQNFILCQGLSNGRCPWICNFLQSAWSSVRNTAVALIAYTGVGFCVAVQQRKAMREASNRRTVTDTDSYAFVVNFNANERKTAARCINIMSKYRVTFSYGSWNLWADVERPNISDNDRRGFADLAQLAVNMSLDLMPHIERNHVANNFVITEITELSSGILQLSPVYGFNTLVNE